MQFTTITVLLAFFASTIALPQRSASDLQPAESMLEEPAVSEAVVNGATSELSARSGIKTVVAQTCNGENFAYGCRNWLANGGSTSCTNTGSGGQQDNISSIRTFGSTCTFWVDANCKGSAVKLLRGTTRATQLPFGNRISSFACWAGN